MSFSYNKLWKLLIDYKMLKIDSMKKAIINATTISNIGKDKPVSLETLSRIYKVLNCNIGDIVNFINT